MEAFEWYGSVAGIVVATVLLVEILKRTLGNQPWFGRVPTWLYAIVVSAVLTATARYGLHTLAGDWLPLFNQAVLSAAVASGFKEWISNGTKPLSASTAARTQRGELP